MTDEQMDEKQGLSDSPDDLSTSETDISSGAAGGETDVDEVVSLKKSDWEKTQKELDSIKQTLKIEREKRRQLGLSVQKKEEEHEEREPQKKEEVIRQIYRQEREAELRKEREEFEAAEKKKIVKRFPSLYAENDFGIADQIVENYQDLLEGRISRGKTPKTQSEVAQLIEQAVKMAHPDLFVKELEEKRQYESVSLAYTGMPVGGSEKRQPEKGEKLSEADKQFDTVVNSFLKN